MTAGCRLCRWGCTGKCADYGQLISWDDMPDGTDDVRDAMAAELTRLEEWPPARPGRTRLEAPE